MGLRHIPATPPAGTVIVPCPALQPAVVLQTILNLLESHSFNIYHTIDPFVQSKSIMPRDIQRHLLSVEEEMLQQGLGSGVRAMSPAHHGLWGQHTSPQQGGRRTGAGQRR